MAGAIWAHSCVTPPVFWPWRWWRHVDNDPTISVASRACFLLLAQTGGCVVAGPNIGTVTRYKVPVLPITPSPASPARLTYDIFSQHYYTATTSPIYVSVHNYSTYPMLLHKCSKNVVFLNEICSKYVVNWGKKSKICSIYSFIHHKFYMSKKCPNKH